jgi:hypothetical protein
MKLEIEPTTLVGVFFLVLTIASLVNPKRDSKQPEIPGTSLQKTISSQSKYAN